jgi:5-methylcytosine-specific restriction protein B
MPEVEESQTIAQALATWDRAAAHKKATEAERLRDEFVERFPMDRWADLSLESYALGREVEGGSFCWWLEFKTKPVGSISGGSARKHLIWWSRNDGVWRYPKEYSSVDEAWAAVRDGFKQIFQLASAGQFDETDDVGALSTAVMLRLKTLYMYFPEELLPVSSRDHLQRYLTELGDPATSLSPVRANRRLLQLLRDRRGLTGLSSQDLGIFVYHWLNPRTTTRIVKIAPGEQARFWPDCLAQSYICVGWDKVGDLSLYEDKDAFREAFRAQYPYGGNQAQVSRKANELWMLMELEAGDKIIANKGTSEVLAIGTVTDAGYSWRQDREEYRHTVAVDWDTSAARRIDPVRAWATTTVARVGATLYRLIRDDDVTPPVDELYVEIEQSLHRRGQVILYGPPGTGKTYAARRAAVWILDGGSARPSAAHLFADEQRFKQREGEFGRTADRAHSTWLMVANPSQWRWSNLEVEGEVDYSYGRLQRNYPRVRAGDLVVGYESAPTQRVVALARVTGEYDPGGPPTEALTLESVAPVRQGLSWRELHTDNVLATSEPVRFRCQGSLFALNTVEADHLLARLVERDSSLGLYAQATVQRLTWVTFHPSYTYEDFVEGFRPQQSGAAGGLELVLTDGVFKQVCATASADPDREYLIIIDEINRGNVPKVFGELISLIEMDKRGLNVRLPQSGEDFAVPPNLFIIGTMNTADRSIHLLDTALRRRFAFVELLPDPDLLAGATVGPLALDVFLEMLNERVRERIGREKQVGHALFFDGVGRLIDTPEQFAGVFRHELLPQLQEYVYDDYRDLAALLGPGVIDIENQRLLDVVGDPAALCATLARTFGATPAK